MQLILKAAQRFVAEQECLPDQISEKKSTSPDKSQPETLFSVIRRSKGAPDSEKTASRISQEGTEMFMASFTPGRTMMLFMYYLHAHPDVLEKLRKELDEVNPDPSGELGYKALNSLPYLVSLAPFDVTSNFSLRLVYSAP